MSEPKNEPKKSIVPVNKAVADIKGKTTEDLVRELVGLMGYTAEKLQRMAFIVAELEGRGKNIESIRDRFLMIQLRRIAAGDLLPEVLATFLGNRTVVDALARLPLAAQKWLLDAGNVDVLIDGSMQTIQLDHLTRESIAIAFGPDHVRTEAEQRQATKQAIRDIRKRSEPHPEPAYRVRPVPERNGIKIGNSFAAVEDVIPVLAELQGPIVEIDVNDPKTDTVTIRVTEEEKQHLKALCARRGLPEWHLAREALKACGLI